MQPSKPLTLERLREILSYDPETGIFTWLKSHKPALVGRPAGCLNWWGYHRISINRKSHQAHRLAWVMHYGEWPQGEIDHINGIRDDNRIANLREADRSLNMQNVSIRRTNTSGYAGVSYNPKTNQWRAQIRIRGRTTLLGNYDTPEQASAAYVEAKRRAVPGFSRPTSMEELRAN